jgi:hypothetical protein
MHSNVTRVIGRASLALTLSVAACGSPDSPSGGTPSGAANPPPAVSAAPARPSSVEGFPEVPAPSGDWTNKIADLERDLQNLTAGGRGAAKDFADDLDGLAESSEIKPTRSTLDALAKELATVLPKTNNGEVLRRRLAELLFVATRRSAIGPDRITTLQSDVERLLTTHGTPAASAKSIAAHVGTIARDARRAA